MARYPTSFHRRERAYDRLHRGVVGTLMGITVLGISFLGYQVYDYFYRIRPLRLQQWREGREYELSVEQQAKEAELLRLQKAAEK